MVEFLIRFIGLTVAGQQGVLSYRSMILIGEASYFRGLFRWVVNFLFDIHISGRKILLRIIESHSFLQSLRINELNFFVVVVVVDKFL